MPLPSLQLAWFVDLVHAVARMKQKHEEVCTHFPHTDALFIVVCD